MPIPTTGLQELLAFVCSLNATANIFELLKRIVHNINVKSLVKNTMNKLTTTLATSKNVLFLGHNHLRTTGTDNSTLWNHPGNNQSVRSSVPVVTWWIVACLCI